MFISACNWVDSTGVQKGTISPVAQGIQGVEPSNFDSGQVRIVSVSENSSTEIVPTINLGTVDSDWTWGAPYQTGALPACTIVEGFEPHLTMPTLAQACTDPGECEIAFEYSRSDTDQVSFDVRLPELKAPIGLAYALTATNSEGQTVNEFLTLCAVSINEAPLAEDDFFNLNASMTTTISYTDSVHLLSNDSDDLDVRNQALKVNSVAVVNPELAEKFILFENGGFIYQPRPALSFPPSSPLFDSFVYAVTDGQHESVATVRLRIRNVAGDANSPPVIFTIDDEVITAGDTFTIKIDAEDEDRDPLTFSLSSDSPDFVNIDTDTGTMTGVSETPGSYTITVIADDGSAQTSLSFMLFVQTKLNRPPFADDIQNKTVTDEFAYDVSGFFGDPDSDTLNFSATSLPDDTQISADGIISGKSTTRNRGRHIIRVFVSDGRGGVASDGFRLTIR